MITGRECEFEELRTGRLAGREPPVESALKQIFLAPGSRGSYFRRGPDSPLELEKSLQNTDRGNDQKFSSDAYELLTFEPGSIGDTAVSTSARTFLPTTGGQSLIADLIAHGITGVKGYTDEPLLQAVTSPSIGVERYFVSGYTLAESFYAASRFVGWEDVVIGDPLCTYVLPGARRAAQINK